jgi:hypothetical protein
MRVITVFVLILLCSCNKRSVDLSDSQHVLVIDLDLKPGPKVKRLSEFAENIEYVPLQTTKSSLIGPFILKIVNRENRIYILNGGLEGDILCFNIHGRFLYKINNKGRGPEEYTIANDFDVNSENKTLAILSSTGHKLVKYGISDTGFTFQNSISLNTPAPYKFCMAPETDNLFLAIPPWRGTEPTLSLLINAVGDTIHFKSNCYKYKMVKKTHAIASSEMLVYSISNIVCFKEEFSDTVFYVDANDNSFKPRMIFDSHGNSVTPAMRGGSEKYGNDVTRIDHIFETKRYVFFWYRTIRSLNGILFDKTNKNLNLLTVYGNDDFTDRILKNGIVDDLSGGPSINIEFDHDFISGGKIFSVVNAMELKKFITEEDFKNAKVIYPQKKNELKKLADSLKETDNPVLVIVTPKE